MLSKFGYAIGNYWKAWKDEKKEKGEDHKTLGLGSAITASAAAFNSNMGSVSMTLGAGVTFLCTALNLRLGLWLPHPLSKKHGASEIMPGWPFFKEMFGQTNCGLRPPAVIARRSRGTRPPPDNRKPVAEDIHLSDGAHFENLALYELVRRHCRYIIVSDCGTDPEVTFDDFGNAVRRIREDFGVEIEIDLSPLKPNEARLSKQHVAVGTSPTIRGATERTTPFSSTSNLCSRVTSPATSPSIGPATRRFRTSPPAINFTTKRNGNRIDGSANTRRFGPALCRAGEAQEDVSPDAIFNGARWEWYQSLSGGARRILELTVAGSPVSKSSFARTRRPSSSAKCIRS